MRRSKKTEAPTALNNLSIAEVALMLGCDQKYVELMVEQERLRPNVESGRATRIELESVIAMRRQSWQEIERVVVQVIRAFEQESVATLVAEYGELNSKRRPRRAPNTKEAET